MIKFHGAVLCVALLFITTSLDAATTGKITGNIIDAETGSQLLGANIVIQGTQMGTASDQNGLCFNDCILNHPG